MQEFYAADGQKVYIVETLEDMKGWFPRDWKTFQENKATNQAIMRVEMTKDDRRIIAYVDKHLWKQIESPDINFVNLNEVFDKLVKESQDDSTTIDKSVSSNPIHPQTPTSNGHEIPPCNEDNGNFIE
jgi:hypothetical protein